MTMKHKAGFCRGLLPLVLALAFLLCACGEAAASSSQSEPLPPAPPAPSALPQDDALGYRLLCALPYVDSQTMTEVARGVQDRCDELGISLTMHNAHRDHMSQALAVDAFVESGGQALVCLPVDFAAMQPFLALARQQGVFVVGLAESLVPNTVPPADAARAWADAAVGVDSYAAGRLLGENAAAFAKNLTEEQEFMQAPVPETPAAVLLLEGARTPFALGVEEGYSAAWPEDPAPVTTHIIPESADLLAQSLFAENPDIRIVLAGSDAAALAAREGLLRSLTEAQAAEEGLAQTPPAEPAQAQTPEPPLPPDVSAYYFGGVGASLEGVAALRDGRLSASISQSGYAMGVQAVEAAVALLGAGPAETQNQNQAYTVEPVLVDRSNAAGYNR